MFCRGYLTVLWYLSLCYCESVSPCCRFWRSSCFLLFLGSYKRIIKGIIFQGLSSSQIPQNNRIWARDNNNADHGTYRLDPASASPLSKQINNQVFMGVYYQFLQSPWLKGVSEPYRLKMSLVFILSAFLLVKALMGTWNPCYGIY